MQTIQCWIGFEASTEEKRAKRNPGAKKQMKRNKGEEGWGGGRDQGGKEWRN